MTRPVLVRTVDYAEDAPEAFKFAAACNVASTQGQSPVRQAASLARLFDPALLDHKGVNRVSHIGSSVRGEDSVGQARPQCAHSSNGS